MTARERARTLMDISELWTSRCRISDVAMDAMLNWAEAAILAHAEAVREQCCLAVCPLCQVGVEVVLDPVFGWRHPYTKRLEHCKASAIRAIQVT